MAGKRGFEEQIAALDAVRDQLPEVRLKALRSSLKHRNNFLVAKAAELTREFRASELTGELLAAFERFFEDPVKTDPQCWAKNAISRALAAMEYQDPRVFLRGMRHIQMEPVWGGRSDTAGTLRSTCALALVQCRSLSESELLVDLIDLLADKDKSVRAETVRAIEQVGSPSAALLLRLRAVLRHEEPEVLGACFGAVLRIEGMRALSWVQEFLLTADDTAGEAALAIAETHSVEGFEVLKVCLRKTEDSWFRSVLLSAIALTRLEAAIEFLMELVKKESSDAECAIEAIVRAMPTASVMTQLETAVKGKSRLERALAVHRNR
jgi:HEAT repeat protein